MNETIFRFFNNFASQSETLDALIIFSAEHLGYILIAILIIIFFAGGGQSSRNGVERGLTSRSKKSFLARDIIIIIFSAILAWLIAGAIKYSFPSPRPFLTLPDINLLFEHGAHDSFPSGHATFFSALATATYFYRRNLAYIFIIGALLIGVARITAGIHWPIDILAGYALGALVAYITYRLLKKK